MTKKKYPPLIMNFIDTQEKYPDAVVATEVGGFFEIWQLHDDSLGHAKRVSEMLDLVLTKRSKKDPFSPFMVGFPSHSGHGYFQKLVSLGETVVVVEQAIRGKRTDQNKNVLRKVSKILSPGTNVENLDYKSNYFMSLYIKGETAGVTLADVSTGEVNITEINVNEINDFVSKNSPKEIIVNNNKLNLSFSDEILLHVLPEKKEVKRLVECSELFSQIYEIKNVTSNKMYSISEIGLEKWPTGAISLGNLINYLMIAEYNSLLLKKISKPKMINLSDNLSLNKEAIDSLEILNSEGSYKNTLIGTIDKCKTAMGKRLLRQWIISPSKDIEKIKHRHLKVEELIKNKKFYEELSGVYDFSRIARKMIFGRLMPHEINQFYNSLKISRDVLKKEKNFKNKKITELIKLIDSEIDLKTSLYSTDGLYEFLEGSLSSAVAQSKSEWLKSEKKLEKIKAKYQSMVEKTLKISEKKDSYFLSCPKSCEDDLVKNGVKIVKKTNEIQIVDDEWVKNSINTISLKYRYKKVAEDIFKKFQIETFDKFGKDILEFSEKVSLIDVISNFAQISFENGYIKPEIVEEDNSVLELADLRHAVVEKSELLSEGFVSNTVSLSELNTLVIYGANSAGKSTILKSVGVAIIMNQIGCFVPCSKAKLSIYDNLMTRMSTSDSLSEGFSTFTMEVKELNDAIKIRDNRCLFLFDEIGRGTSVSDGESIAYATLAYLKDNDRSKILFATHYHDLSKEIKSFKNLKIVNMSCHLDENGILIFPRKLENGPGTGSYGIDVAASVLPRDFISIAKKYNKKMFPVKSSNYNKKVVGSICPLCKENEAQETHHIVEQKQGSVKDYKINGSKKNIHNKDNLIMICASCHSKITRNEMDFKKIKTSEGSEYKIINKK